MIDQLRVEEIKNQEVALSEFGNLCLRRKRVGFEEYAIIHHGERVDRALFIDTSWESLEELADAHIYLDFEIQKLESKGLRLEARRLEALKRTVRRVAEDLLKYRERAEASCPDLLRNCLSEVRP